MLNYLDKHVHTHSGKGENIDVGEILNLVYKLQVTVCCTGHWFILCTSAAIFQAFDTGRENAAE